MTEQTIKEKLADVLAAHAEWFHSDRNADSETGTMLDLENADLRGAFLGNTDLTGASLRGADLTDADLTDADLTNANLHNANLHGADLYCANLTIPKTAAAYLTEPRIYPQGPMP